MAKRLINRVSLDGGRTEARIYRDTDWGEFVVQLRRGNKHILPSADYFTDDRADAEGTARAMLAQVAANGS